VDPLTDGTGTSDRGSEIADALFDGLFGGDIAVGESLAALIEYNDARERHQPFH